MTLLGSISLFKARLLFKSKHCSVTFKDLAMTQYIAVKHSSTKCPKNITENTDASL